MPLIATDEPATATPPTKEAWLAAHAPNATPEQAEAITTEADTTCAIAGPGSGKTWTFVRRIQFLISQGADPQSIHAVTFTNAAAAEIQHRLGAIRIGYLGTLHGMMLRTIERDGFVIGYGSRVTVLNEARTREIMADTAKTLGIKGGTERLLKLRESGIPAKPKTPDEIAVAAYAKKLRSLSAVDFGLILEDGLRTLQRRPYVERKMHLLVDEFQDSGELDFAIYAELQRQGAIAFLVGDPDQAIYGFRGGRLENILTVANDSRTKLIRLEGNFRCARQICAAANRLVAFNRNRVDKKTKATRESEGRVLVDQAGTADDAAERALIGADILRAINEGIPANELAVLSRTNAQRQQMLEYLRGQGIPVKESKAPPASRMVAKIQAALNLLNDPTNEMAILDWLDHAFGAHAARGTVEEARRRQIPLHEMPGHNWQGGQDLWGDELFCRSAKMGLRHEEIEAMKKAAEGIETPSLSALSYAIGANQQWTDTGSGVTVATMHAAKGREWERVWIQAAEEQTMPGKAADVEEERRIFFVAVTRAKEKLTVTWARQRRSPYTKEMEARTQSRFAEELFL